MRRALQHRSSISEPEQWLQSYWLLDNSLNCTYFSFMKNSKDFFLFLFLRKADPWCKLKKIKLKKKWKAGLPWWCSGWESACQCRGHGFEPWSGKIPHATEQLGPWATITEPARLEPVLRNKRGPDSERSAHRDEEWPPLAATRGSPHTETKTQHSQK